MFSEFPLLVFTVLTGFAAGGYSLYTLQALLAKRKLRDWRMPLIFLITLAIGLLGVLGHLGHPERFLNALANPTAGITQEAYWFIPFGCVLLVDLIILKVKKSGNIAIPIVGTVLGIGLMIATSVAYFTSYGVAGWPEVPTLFFFIVGDLALGASFAIAMSDAASKQPSENNSVEPAFRTFPSICIALYLALAITLIVEAVVFAGLAVGPWGFIIAAILAAAACSLQATMLVRKVDFKASVWVCFLLVAAAVIISRYAFYAMF